MNINFAILGGTHGNEFTGIEVIKLIQELDTSEFINTYQCILANPEAYKQQKRFIDSDLNRGFGQNGTSQGHEAKRSAELKSQVKDKFDFIIDLHSTTTQMGLTIILTHTDELSLKAACFLQDLMPEIKLITTAEHNSEVPYTTAMAKSGILIEVGAVAHNVLSAEYIIASYKMVIELLNFDFSTEIDLEKRTYFQTTEHLYLPKEKGYYIHPNLEHNDLKALKPNDPLFINIAGDILYYEGKSEVYPFFINEAAYQYQSLAMTLSDKRNDLRVLLTS